jgi:DNA-binding HxlR family transcriptional regulator
MKKNRSSCPLTSALDIIGDKWSLLIIRDIFLGKKTFTEFLNSGEKIATNILSNRLELLTNCDLLMVTKMPNDQKTKIYYLTDSGIDMYPIIYEMMRWSERNLKKKFGPLGMELLNSFQKKSADKVITETTSKYRVSREEILSKIN